MKLDKRLQDLFDELQNNAYNPTYHNYYYKEANQIIRKHVEALLIHDVSSLLKAEREATKEEIREWLISEDFEGLAERL